MSQNPFANPYDLPETVMPERTSVMAVLSLVLGIVCVPVFGLIGMILGVFALFGIKASRGRVSGTGLAVTGIILGILMTVVWGTCLGGSVFVLNMARTQIGPAAGAIIVSAQSGDYEGVKGALASSTQTRIAPEDVEAFRSALAAEMGAYKGGAGSMSQLFDEYRSFFGAIGQSGGGAAGQIQSYDNHMPIPLEFENGWAMVWIGMPRDGQGGGTTIPIENIVVMTPTGAEIVLVPFGTRLPPSPAPGDPVAPEGEGAKPDAAPADAAGEDKPGGE